MALASRAPAPRLRLSLIGDSVAASVGASLAARQQLAAYDLAIDARVCRRTAAPSCPWHGEVAPTARDVVAATPGDLGDVVVLVTGYNDDPRRFGTDATNVLHDLVAAGVRQVVWLDLRVAPTLPPAAQARERAINATLAALDRASPVLRVAPWNAYSAGHSDWFFDPIHLRSTGAVQLARFIGAQVAGSRATAPRLATGPGRGARCRTANTTGVRPGRAMAGVLPRAGPVVLRPARVLVDTRPDSSDAIGRQLGAGRELRLAVAGRSGVPQSATSAMVRVQVTQACGGGTVTVGGCGLAPSAAAARGPRADDRGRDDRPDRRLRPRVRPHQRPGRRPRRAPRLVRPRLITRPLGQFTVLGAGEVTQRSGREAVLGAGAGGEAVGDEGRGDPDRPLGLTGPAHHRVEIGLRDRSGAQRGDEPAPALAVGALERATARPRRPRNPSPGRVRGTRSPDQRHPGGKGQASQRGARGRQRSAPRSSIAWFQAHASPWGTAASAARWTSAPVNRRPPTRASTRATFVSTTATSRSKAKASTARAVYGPTPGSRTSSR